MPPGELLEHGTAAQRTDVDAVEHRSDHGHAELASRTCWATMQGLVSLHPAFSRIGERSGATVVPIGDLAEQFADVVFVGLMGRGSGPDGS